MHGRAASDPAHAATNDRDQQPQDAADLAVRQLWPPNGSRVLVQPDLSHGTGEVTMARTQAQKERYNEMRRLKRRLLREKKELDEIKPAEPGPPLTLFDVYIEKIRAARQAALDKLATRKRS